MCWPVCRCLQGRSHGGCGAPLRHLSAYGCCCCLHAAFITECQQRKAFVLPMVAAPPSNSSSNTAATTGQTVSSRLCNACSLRLSCGQHLQSPSAVGTKLRIGYDTCLACTSTGHPTEANRGAKGKPKALLLQTAPPPFPCAKTLTSQPAGNRVRCCSLSNGTTCQLQQRAVVRCCV